MPAVDSCHDNVVRALEKDGWQVTSHRYLFTRARTAYVDIEATRQQNGERNTLLFAEVKCFAKDMTEELYSAVGQYLIYQLMLNEVGDTTPLYLAVPVNVYEKFDVIARRAMKEFAIKMITVNLDTETVVQWIT